MDSETFKEQMGLRWRGQIWFIDRGDELKARRRAAYAMRKKELSMRETWLGARYRVEITKHFLPDLSIRYIDPILKYGVFAETIFFKGEYLGEYTGMVRKRKPRSDRKNDYCFEYTIGDWCRNPFIIDAQNDGNATRFMNHSEDPNVESLSVFANGLMHIIFVAARKIDRGEQLCYHYGEVFWKKRRRALKIDLGLQSPTSSKNEVHLVDVEINKSTPYHKVL